MFAHSSMHQEKSSQIRSSKPFRHFGYLSIFLPFRRHRSENLGQSNRANSISMEPKVLPHLPLSNWGTLQQTGITHLMHLQGEAGQMKNTQKQRHCSTHTIRQCHRPASNPTRGNDLRPYEEPARPTGHRHSPRGPRRGETKFTTIRCSHREQPKCLHDRRRYTQRSGETGIHLPYPTRPS